jgi:hypothetical protein
MQALDRGKHSERHQPPRTAPTTTEPRKKSIAPERRNPVRCHGRKEVLTTDIHTNRNQHIPERRNESGV